MIAIIISSFQKRYNYLITLRQFIYHEILLRISCHFVKGTSYLHSRMSFSVSFCLIRNKIEKKLL